MFVQYIIVKCNVNKRVGHSLEFMKRCAEQKYRVCRLRSEANLVRPVQAVTGCGRDVKMNKRGMKENKTMGRKARKASEQARTGDCIVK